MSTVLFEYARDAKGFMQQAGEAVICDELIMRAAVAYRMLERRGMLAADGLTADGRESGRCADEHDRRWTRSHAIAIIAHNFDDRPWGPRSHGRTERRAAACSVGD